MLIHFFPLQQSTKTRPQNQPSPPSLPMKFLDISSFLALNLQLEKADIGDALLWARLEGYSCKLAGDNEKRLVRSLNNSLEDTRGDPTATDERALHLLGGGIVMFSVLYIFCILAFLF